MKFNLKKKYLRLFQSRAILYINLIIHKWFKEKDLGSLNLIENKPTRQHIVQKIIDKKKL